MSHPSSATPVLVLSGHVIALGVVRALGEASIPVYLAYYEPGDIAQVSRYVREAYKVPHPANDESGFIARLQEIGRNLPRPLLVPGDDASLIAIARHESGLRAHFTPGYPSLETVERIIDKRRTYDLARTAGVPVPRTINVTTATEAGTATDQIGYPCIIKPTASHFYYDHFGVKYRFVRSRAEAEAAFTEATGAGVSVMAQEFIAGDDQLGINYNAYAVEGEVLVDFTARKVRMSPPGGGVPSAVVSHHLTDVITLGRQTLRALRYSGYACTEFKWDTRQQRYVLFEVNGRYNRSNLLATRAGLNFPLIEYRHRLEGTLPVSPHSVAEMYWIDEFKDLASFPKRIRLNSRNLLLFWRPYFHGKTFAVFDWHDWRPLRLRLRIILRSLCARLTARRKGSKPA